MRVTIGVHEEGIGVIRMVQLGIDHMHAEAYRGTLGLMRDRIEIVGFLARPDDPRTSLPGFEGVPVFRSLDDLLNGVQFDAAQVMLRNNEMGAALETLADSGIHLWLEKPIARRAADLRPVAEKVAAKGLVVTLGYQSRFYPTTAYARRLVQEGVLGPLTFAHMTTATTTIKWRKPDGPNGFIFDDAISGGGIFHWLGCHMVDLLLHIVGQRPETVTALTATAGEAAVEVEDVAAVGLRFPGGWVASLNYGYLFRRRRRRRLGTTPRSLRSTVNMAGCGGTAPRMLPGPTARLRAGRNHLGRWNGSRRLLRVDMGTRPCWRWAILLMRSAGMMRPRIPSKRRLRFWT